jgi:hypothetical protein
LPVSAAWHEFAKSDGFLLALHLTEILLVWICGGLTLARSRGIRAQKKYREAKGPADLRHAFRKSHIAEDMLSRCGHNAYRVNIAHSADEDIVVEANTAADASSSPSLTIEGFASFRPSQECAFRSSLEMKKGGGEGG